MTADIITGVCLAVARKSDNTLNGKLESRQLIKGLYKKIGELVLYFLAVVISFFSNSDAVYIISLSVLIGHEGLSIIENLGLLKVPIPVKLYDILEVLTKRGDKDDEKK